MIDGVLVLAIEIRKTHGTSAWQGSRDPTQWETDLIDGTKDQCLSSSRVFAQAEGILVCYTATFPASTVSVKSGMAIGPTTKNGKT